MSIPADRFLRDNQTIPILEGRDLVVRRAGFPILDVSEISISAGEVLALIGPNGAGKSTLLTALCLLTKTLSGSVMFKGEKVGAEIPVDGYRTKIAMVFQEALLFDTTVFRNVASGLKFRRMKKSQINSIVEENLDRFGITRLKDRSARTLSGGEAQRVSLARAFALNPDILFLDEPFSALDPPTRESLITDLENALKKARTTAVFATHDRMEALRLSDRIAVMNNGKILQIGYPEEVMNHPVDEFTASFVGIETVLEGRIIQAQDGNVSVDIAGYTVEIVGNGSPGEHVVLCIRPENVIILDPSAEIHTSARNVFAGSINRITKLGLYYRVDVDCGFPLVAHVTGRSVEEMSLKNGKRIKISFKATAVHVLKTR
ncbi:MAG TPA: ABC transporter ATP-binding protein [Syntrophorhabdaceae bacterium]|nr:ABC transporter ATP-binding protein [Syntrophorhabdaceae bacterium]